MTKHTNSIIQNRQKNAAIRIHRLILRQGVISKGDDQEMAAAMTYHKVIT